MEWDICPLNSYRNPYDLLDGSHLCLLWFSSCVWLWTLSSLRASSCPRHARLIIRRFTLGWLYEVKCGNICLTVGSYHRPKPFKHLTHQPSYVDPILGVPASPGNPEAKGLIPRTPGSLPNPAPTLRSLLILIGHCHVWASWTSPHLIFWKVHCRCLWL